MASGNHDVLANLGFTLRGEVIERTLDSFVTRAHGTGFQSRLKTLLIGFRSWRDSLACFDGDLNKAITAGGFLAEMERVMWNMDRNLNNTGGTAAENEAFQHEAEAFNQALHALIKLFPRTDAQHLRAQELANSVQDDARNQENSFTLPPEAPAEDPMLTRTDSAPPVLDMGAEAASPHSQPSRGGHKYGNFHFSGNASGRLGDILNLSTWSKQIPASGSTFGNTTVTGHAIVHAGNTYTSTKTEHPVYQNLNADTFEPNAQISRSNMIPARTSVPPQTSFLGKPTGILPGRNLSEPMLDDTVL